MSIYAPKCSSAAREEPTAVTPCHLPVLEGGMMQEPELGTSPHAAAADTGPLKRIPLWWGTAEHCQSPTLLGALKHQDSALSLI